ncbi:hypothetical protein FF38_02049 [Lucilia cuprina]|uniref:Kazal-like domain-containing protein n=1 Tax=Lucilia cuprina TaxID=7375 RepID=A0A0L0BW87_LUCCU|nr:hypothetical protein CVS40_9970 [Lucilia cuprina]KNC24286.1 hypothetical protein FF38_02049 [Lucilia cuprina]
MHSATSCIILLFGLVFCVMGENDKSNCVKPCPRNFAPICTNIQIDGKPFECTFPNDCYLDIYKCKNDIKELEQKPGTCGGYPPECADIVLNIEN